MSNRLNPLVVEEMPLSALSPFPQNPRAHPKKQLKQLGRSLEEYGFNRPILVDRHLVIISGHGLYDAAREVGLEKVPVTVLGHLTPAQVKGYRIADNKLAESSQWHEELLRLNLEMLRLDGEDLTLTGFDAAELDIILDADAGESNNPADDLPAPEGGPQVSRVGDLWFMGEHRLLCGDARKPEVYASLLDGELARMIFADPPYNVPIKGHVSGLGAVQHREFPMACGEMSDEQFVGFLREVFLQQIAHSVDGAIHFQCIDWRHMPQMLAAGQVYSELKNVCIWVKDNGGMGSFYRSRHEMVFVFKAGTAPHLNNFGLGDKGRYRTNVWEYRGANSRGAARFQELELHPTVKPTVMVADAIKDVSTRGDIVLDTFGGSGTTLIAAHKTGRRARVIELDPVYVDRSIRRWEKWAKEDAIHAQTGRTFAELAEERAAGREAA